MTIRLLLLLLLCMFAQIGIIWLVYKDVSTYTPLPYLSLAQFTGVCLFVFMLQGMFGNHHAELHYAGLLSMQERMGMWINKVIAISVFGIIYFVVKSFR